MMKAVADHVLVVPGYLEWVSWYVAASPRPRGIDCLSKAPLLIRVQNSLTMNRFGVSSYRRLNARRAMKTATSPSRAKEAVQRTPVNVGSASWGAGSRGRSMACFARSIATV